MGRDSARERLVAAGEELYADAGVSRVRLRDLNTLAGVRNDSAVHYHFGSQDGLLDEILRRHLGDVSARVEECTTELCSGRDGSPEAVRDAIAALAIPFAEKLADERGRRFIRIVAQVWGTEDWQRASFVPSSALAMDLIQRSLRCLPADLREERMWLTTRFVITSFASRAQRHTGANVPSSTHAFVFNVVEMAAAAFLAYPPVGEFWPANWPTIPDSAAEPDSTSGDYW